MPDNKIVNLPEMNPEGLSLEELKAKEGSEEETETPAESPAVEKPDDKSEEEASKKEEESEEEVVDDAQKEQGAIEGLQKTKDKLIGDITNLRAKRRTLDEEELPASPKEPEKETPPQIDDDDPDPEATKAIDNRVQQALKSGGYVRKGELDTKDYQQETNLAVDEWVRDEHPEYLPEAADDLWSALKSELKQYGQPASPGKIKDLLNLAHGAIKARFSDRFPSDGALAQEAKKQQLKVAGMGTGGKGGASSRQSSLSSSQKETYRRGGWTEKEIEEMDK